MANNTILIFAEQRDGVLKKAVFEIISAGRNLAGTLSASLKVVLAGSSVDDTVDQLNGWGVDEILVADDPGLERYSAEGYSSVLIQAVREEDPVAVLLAATAMGKDLAPRAAAALDAGLASDCINLSVEDGRLVAQRPVYAGKAVSTVSWAGGGLQMATLRPNVYPAQEQPDSPQPVRKPLEQQGITETIHTRIEEMQQVGGGGKDVTEADIIVAGGRGMKGPEHFALLEALAGTLDAAVGASRAVVDSGWIGHQHQVGQTGKTVSPQLYIAFGISGAIQHLAGMSSSKTIVAVNKDPEAPIFKVANYGIVGDLFEIAPLVTDEVSKLRG